MNTETLITSLQNAGVYPHDVTEITLVETHISWVILTGPYAYKLKKPVDLGFLNFSTLDRRKHYCEEEIRLNARLAPDLYLDVVSINGAPEQPVLNGDGPVLDYAVKMREFNPDQELDKLLARDELTAEHIRLLAEKVADFHQHIAVADSTSPYGTPDRILDPMIENLDQIQALATDHATLLQLQGVRDWTRRSWQAHKPTLELRKASGYIRECHGDLHLHNIALDYGNILIFDCIEFNPNLYWIDVASEIAFTAMDLEDRGQPALAWEFLNRYLQLTGDYDGVDVLRLYLVYRAMVRAKVDCIRAHQHDIRPTEQQQILIEFQSYLTQADRYCNPDKPVLVITHGLSGSGKTSIAHELAVQAGAFHIRSDIERKRLSGLGETQRSGSSVNSGIYTREMSEKTYTRLADIAEKIIRAGYTVIVDAAFLSIAQRRPFTELANRLDRTYFILDCQAPTTELKSRITARDRTGTDASEANLLVLAHQLQTAQELDDQERANSIAIDTTIPLDFSAVLSRLRGHKP